MKAQQIQAQFDAGTRSIRRHGRKRLTVMIAAAAAAVMIGGTLTVGAFNDWNYNTLMNRYFSEWFDAKSDYDFAGQGIDINDTFVTDDYQLTVKSAVFNADSFFVFYDFRFSDALEETIAALGDKAMVHIDLHAEVVASGKKPQFRPGNGCGTMQRRDDGVYEITDEYSFRDERGQPFSEDFSELRLAVTPFNIRIEKRVSDNRAEVVFSDEYWEYQWEAVYREYSLEPIVSAPGIYREMPVTLKMPSVVPDVPDKTFTFDSISITTTKLTLHYTSANDTEEERTLYQNHRVCSANFNAFIDEAKITLIYDSGEKHSLKHPRGSGTWMQTDDYGNLSQAELIMEFPEPVSTDGLKEIRINKNRIPLN